MSSRFLFLVKAGIIFMVLGPHCARAQTPVASGAIISSRSIMLRMLEIPEVRQAHEACVTSTGCAPGGAATPAPNATPGSSIMDSSCQDKIANCIWNEMGNQGKQAQIMAALGSLSGSGSSSGEFENLELGTIGAQKDRAFAGMNTFFKTQLEQALYGEFRANTVNTVDHKSFLQIYETRVSKSLVEAITAFCIDTDPTVAGTPTNRVYKLGTDTPPAATPTPAAASVTSATATPTPTPAPASGSVQAHREAHATLLSDGKRAGQVWQTCAADIRLVCTYLSSGSTCPNEIIASDLASSAATPAAPSTGGTPTPTAASTPRVGHGAAAKACAGDEHTQIEACKVETAMKQARQALNIAGELKTAFERRTDGGSFQLANVNVYSGGARPGEKSIDEVSTITSKDVSEHFGSGAQAESQRLSQACGVSGGGAGAPAGDFNAAGCQEFVMSEEQAKAAENSLTEYSLRSKVLSEKLKEKLVNDARGEELTKYLKETGMGDDEIAAITRDEEKKQKVVAGIVSNYEAQRLQVIKDLQGRIKSKSSTSATFGREEVSSAAESMRAELASEPERFKRVAHYSNLITVFLSGGEAGGVSMTSSVSAERELANSAINAETNTAIQNNLNTQGLGGGGAGGTQAQQSLINKDGLNSILIDK